MILNCISVLVSYTLCFTVWWHCRKASQRRWFSTIQSATIVAQVKHHDTQN